MAVSIIEGGTEDSVYDIQQRSDTSVQPGILGEDGVTEVLVPRFIYSKLGNLTDNKLITDELTVDEQNEYSFFLQEMNKLFIEKTLGSEVSDNLQNIAEIDEYLGKLGMTMEYPFKDDSYSVAEWVPAIGQEESRNVRSYILDPTDFEPTNVITNIDGEDYNVIHNT